MVENRFQRKDVPMSTELVGPPIVVTQTSFPVWRRARDAMVRNRDHLIKSMKRYPLICEIGADSPCHRFVFENAAELDNAIARINAGLARAVEEGRRGCISSR